MRFILTLAVLSIFTFSVAQQSPSPECDALIKTELDSLSGEYARGSRADIVISKEGKDALTISFLVMDRTVILSFTAMGGVYCMDETNKVNIFFRDGSSMEMTNSGKFNCDGDFSLFFYGSFGNKKQYDQLMTKEIDRVKVGLRKSVVDKTRATFIEAVIPPDKSKVIMQTASCLLE
jgi:hypothetical protein